MIKTDMAIKNKINPIDLLETGRLYLDKGDFKSARNKFKLALMYNPRLASEVALLYERILENDPDSINARLSIADLHLYLGEVEGATQELEEILDLDPGRVEIYNILGRLYLKQGDIDSVINIIELAFKSGIKDTSLTEMLAGAYIEKGRIDDAISLYDGLVQINPKNKNYFRILGELKVRVGQFEAAAKSFYSMLDADNLSVSEVIHKLEEVKKKQPENIFVRVTLADAYSKGVDPAAAVAELEDILGLDAGRIDSVIAKFREMLDRYPDEPSTLKALGRALTSKGEYSEAVTEYRKLIRYNDQNIDDAIVGFKDILSKYPAQVHAHESLGDANLKLGRIEEAMYEYLEVLKESSLTSRAIIDKCLRSVKENPNMILIHQVLGRSYLLAGETALAIEEAEFMIYLNKNHAPAHEILGDAYMKTQNNAKAKDSYAAAMKLDPYNVTLHKKYENASSVLINDDISALKKRAEEDPWKLGIHLDIAKLFLLLGDFEKAVKELQLAVKDTARAPFAHNLLGISFIEMGRFDLAVIQFERALEIMPKELSDLSKAVKFNCAASYEAMGSISIAIAQYEALLSEDVEFSGVQDRVKSLGSISPDSQRNKYIAVMTERLGQKDLLGMCGRDSRHKEVGSDAFNVSFGQDHNQAGFEHFIKGRHKGAIEEFSLASQLDPKFCAAINNLAVMLFKEGQLEQAETRLKFAQSIDPGSAIIQNNLGVLYLLKKDIQAASDCLNKALELDPGLSVVYINLGDAMYLSGDAQNAISVWEKVKNYDPLSPIATRRLSYKTIIT